MPARRRQRPASRQSTMTIRRKKAAANLVGAFNAWGEKAAARLEERLIPVLEDGETMPDLRLLFRLLGRLARRSTRELDEADAERWMGGMHLMTLQDRCRQAKAELAAAVSDVRKTLVDLFGSKHVRFRFGLAERTPRGTADLAIEAGRLAERLAAPDLKLPAPRLPGVEADPEGWVVKLKAPHEQLARALVELEQRRIGASDRVLDKRRALQSFDQTQLHLAQSFEALLTLAGEKDLASRLRPKARKKARPADSRARVRKAVERARAAVAGFFRWLADLWRRLIPATGRRRRKSRVSREMPLARSCLKSPIGRASAVSG